jgi:GT2 family glycosyltransferase
MGVTVLRRTKNAGPSSARNLGARHATGEILFFVDADVVIADGAVGRVADTFERHPEVDAVFGSYDSEPRATGLVSQYRNLLHHYVHQHGEVAASTFWGACGAIRRSVFERMGGFDEARYPRCIEDIELGYRLRRAGHRIMLDKGLLGTHLKKWSLRSMIRTDVYCRAIPWTRLILETKRAPDDLNLRDGQRVSAALVALALLAVPLALFRVEALFVTAAALLLVIFLNRSLYAFYLRHRGWRFAIGAVGLHLLYFIYGGLAYGWVLGERRLWGGDVTFAVSQGGPQSQPPAREPASPRRTS